jgi:hypothetical protein
MVCVTPFFTTVSEPFTGVNLMGVPTAAAVVLFAPKPENVYKKKNYVHNKNL